jgi:hypothetical protein
VKKSARHAERRKRAGSVQTRALKWGALLAVIAVIGYAVSQMDGIAYGERELSVVNFSDLSADRRRSALKAANEARCTCGCGMTLAQCVATDSTCPVREGNIDRIRTMVRERMRS